MGNADSESAALPECDDFEEALPECDDFEEMATAVGRARDAASRELRRHILEPQQQSLGGLRRRGLARGWFSRARARAR